MIKEANLPWKIEKKKDISRKMKVKHFCGIHFYNHKKKYFITTNYKVMYSNLQHQKNLTQTNRLTILKNIILHKIGLGKPHYLLVRSVEKRLESFYKNKFIRGMQSEDLKEYSQFQRSLKIFFPYFMINEFMSVKEIKEKILNISFDQMVEVLPNVYHLDGHLYPQTWSEGFTFKRINYKINFTKVINMEIPEQFDFLFSELQLDKSIHRNSSENTQQKINWSENSKKIVKNIYSKDYKIINTWKIKKENY